MLDSIGKSLRDFIDPAHSRAVEAPSPSGALSASLAGHLRSVDGLRAIAVLAVVLYHFSVPGFGGGFVGVDIFFVISGFLIGGIVWRELTTTGTISLSNFYARRIRRLAPAYAVMALVCLVTAYLVLLPFEFREFGKELISATIYLSNVHFFREAGYFDIAADDKALLHTWSLAVEEQFYLFFPPLLLFLRKSRRATLAVLAAMFVISLGLCVTMTFTSHTAAFYLFPFRAWELLAGALLAIHGYERRETWQHGPLVSWIGIALLAAAIVLVQPGPAFPGIQVVLPVLGAALILYNCRDDNAVNTALSSPGPVFIGLISYSLYLWHWPVVAFSRYYLGGPGLLAIWLPLAFVLAILSWRFVEQPVRLATGLRPRTLFAGTAAMSVVLVAAGSVPYLRNGMADRFPQAVRAHIDASADFLPDWSRCSRQTSGPLQGLDVCTVGPNGPPKFLVWGDSHLRAFMGGLSLVAMERAQPGLLILRAGCPPLFDIIKQESAATRAEDAACTAANAQIRQAIGKMAGIEAILLIGRWSYYAEGRGTGRDSHNTIKLAPALAGGEAMSQRDVFEKAVLATVGELARTGVRVIVLRQVPEIANYDSREAARRLAHHRITPEVAERTMFTIPLSEVVARTAASERPFRKLAADGVITWLDTWGYFCGDTSCTAVRDGRGLLFDNNHATNTTARALRELFAPVMQRNETPPAPKGPRP